MAFLYTGGYRSDETCEIIRSKDGVNFNIKKPDLDGELLDGFGYLPFWASDSIDVPFCYYRYDPDATQDVNKPKMLYPNTSEPLDPLSVPKRNREFYSAPTGDMSGFGKLMNMRPPSCSDSTNTMCLPGRCSVLDTNYLFRLNSKEHVYRFASLGTRPTSETEELGPVGTNLAEQVWAVVVLGRAQCDPMYGGGIVHTDDPATIKFPKNGVFNASVWRRLSNGGENLVYTSDPFNDGLFENKRGTLSGLPTYAFEQWGPDENPNPK